MSGLYNMVMGMNPAFPYLALMVGITQEFAQEHPLGRIRDAWIEPDGKTICILHRNYGSDGEKANANVKSLPTFRRNVPASDETYAWWEFDVPIEYAEAAQMAAAKTDTRNRWTRFMEVADKMKRGVKDEETERALEAGKKVFAGLNYAIQEGVAEVKHASGLLAAEIYTPHSLAVMFICALVSFRRLEVYDWVEPLTWQKALLLVPLFLLAVGAMFTQSFNPFLYYQF